MVKYIENMKKIGKKSIKFFRTDKISKKNLRGSLIRIRLRICIKKHINLKRP